MMMRETKNIISPSVSNVKIMQIDEMAAGIFRMRLESEDIAKHSRPGQFVNIKVSDTDIPFWRRPFSIHQVNVEEGWFDLLFRVIGKGTEILSHKKLNDELNIVGPLGKSFNISASEFKTAYVIGGGLGIAPLLFLIKSLLEFEIRPLLFYGVKTESEFCCLEDFKKLDVVMNLATEDGSTGYRGYVTDLVDIEMQGVSEIKSPVFFACGPNPMLRKVISISTASSVPCQVSLETLMGCGIGACLGCGVKTANEKLEYRYVCIDGPVFHGGEIDLSD